MDAGIDYRLARGVVEEIDPRALPDFDDDWDLWKRNPGAIRPSGAVAHTSFDQSLAEAVITGVAAGATKAALDFLADRLAAEAAGGVARRRRRRSKTGSVPVTAAQAARLSGAVIDQACAEAAKAAADGGASPEQAASVAEALRRQLKLLADGHAG